MKVIIVLFHRPSYYTLCYPNICALNVLLVKHLLLSPSTQGVDTLSTLAVFSPLLPDICHTILQLYHLWNTHTNCVIRELFQVRSTSNIPNAVNHIAKKSYNYTSVWVIIFVTMHSFREIKQKQKLMEINIQLL